MARTQKDDTPYISTPLLVLALIAVVLVIVGGLFFDGLALFWCRLIASGIGAVYLVPWCVHEVRLLGADDGQGVRSSHETDKKSRFATAVEAVFLALAVAMLAYTCIICCMDLPRLSSPEVTRISNADCDIGGSWRGPVTFTLTGIDNETGEKTGFVASMRNSDDFDAARQKAGTYGLVSATVSYLPNSRVVISADF